MSSKFSNRTMRPENWNALKYFKKTEFKRPDVMGYEFMFELEKLRTKAGVAMRISSSYRDPAHNRRVGGAQDSAHTDIPCNAVDVVPRNSVERYAIVKAAMELGWTRIGSIHLDKTDDVRPSHVLWTIVSNPA
jgi:zinc D-Ala-D-Ala carboxypeptidase